MVYTTRTKLWSLFLVLLSGSVRAETFETCVSECRPNSTRCLSIETSKVMSSFHNSLIAVHAATRGGALTKTDLMGIFGYSSDPCRRSEKVLSDSRIENFGRDCVADYQTPVVGFRIEFGRIVLGDIEKSGAWTIANFSQESGFQLQLSAGGNPINNGSWNFVASDGASVLSHVGTQCILLR